MREDFFQRHSRLTGGSKAGMPRLVGWMFVGAAAAVLFAFVFGIFVMLLWNWLIPGLFGLREITYWQAFGIVILAKLLFGGFGHRHSDHRRNLRDRYDDWHERRSLRRDESAPEQTRDQGKYYEQFWRDEGEAAFQAYVDRIEREKEDGS